MNHIDGLSFVIIGCSIIGSVAFNGFINTMLLMCAAFGIGSLLMPLFH